MLTVTRPAPCQPSTINRKRRDAQVHARSLLYATGNHRPACTGQSRLAHKVHKARALRRLAERGLPVHIPPGLCNRNKTNEENFEAILNWLYPNLNKQLARDVRPKTAKPPRTFGEPERAGMDRPPSHPKLGFLSERLDNVPASRVERKRIKMSKGSKGSKMVKEDLVAVRLPGDLVAQVKSRAALERVSIRSWVVGVLVTELGVEVRAVTTPGNGQVLRSDSVAVVEKAAGSEVVFCKRCDGRVNRDTKNPKYWYCSACKRQLDQYQVRVV